MAITGKFANIIVDISHEKLDRIFQYLIPESLEGKLYPGIRVEIPFGKGDRMIKGYVIEITDKPEYDVNKMKYIKCIVEGSIPIESQLISLAAWIKGNYGSTMNQALKTVIPIKTKIRPKSKRYVELLSGEKDTHNLIDSYGKSKKYTARLRLLQELIKEKVLPYELIEDKLNVSATTLKSLEGLGIIKITVESSLRNTINHKVVKGRDIFLSREQREVTENILKDFRDGESKVHLIFGITGSGKTEVYIRLIEEVVAKGRQAIVLIPEISLTYQTVLRFYRQFGERVSFINSRLSKGERHDQFEKARHGWIDIMIGPRSAIFTPFNNLGIIIIDEEHEAAYKNDSVPKYHAREVAIHRAHMSDALVVLGSATPSVDTFYKAVHHEYKMHELKHRANESHLPAVHVVDMREELKNGNRSIFSEKLHELILDRLNHNRQVILFLNRRGYAGFVSCRACGEAIKCIHCDVGLTVHNNGRLVCHYCGYQIKLPETCPKCRSKYIAAFGMGTQKIEAYVKERYPKARVLRMDADTTAGKNAHEKILSEFANHEADILIGTQMIVKGHDFPLVTLVGVIAADLSLYSNDFRSSERTFQLLTQAAGRAGRGKDKGEVVIQTYSPDNFSIISASSQDYKAFYEREILYRKLMKYPPVIQMMGILITSAGEEQVNEAAEFIVEIVAGAHGLQVIGPADANVYKVSDIYRKVLYAKHEEYEILIEVKDRVEERIKELELFKSVGLQFDFNPMSNY